MTSPFATSRTLRNLGLVVATVLIQVLLPLVLGAAAR